MPISKSTATKAVSALIAISVIGGAMTIGGVAQPDSENSDTSGGDAEPNDSMENATPIEYGQEIDANLSSPSDVDYYAVNAIAGDAIIPHLHLKNMVEGGAIQVDVVAPSGEVTTELTNDLIDGPQNTAGEATFSGADTAYTGNVMEFDGTYYVRVKEATNLPVGGLETNESDTYRYNLTVNRTSVDEYEPNENGTTATPLVLNETVNATFAGYDSDVYAVNLAAGQNYTVDLTHAYRDNLYATSKVIWIYGNESQPVDDPIWPHTEDNRSPYHFEPNGSTVATSTMIDGENEPVVFSPTTNGTYYIQIVQGSQNGNLLDRAPYELTVSATGPNDNMANATPIEYGQDVTTTLFDGEEDWYAVDGRAGLGLLADMRHLETVSGGSMQVDVLTSNGEVVTEQNARMEDSPNVVSTEPNTYTHAHAVDVMESNDTYYVRVSESPYNETNASAVYEYTLDTDTDELDRYDPNENGPTATPIALTETTEAVFKGYDSDVYAVNVTSGQTYDVSVGIEMPQSRLKKQLVVYDDAADAVDDPASEPNGTPVAHATGASFEENLTFTAKENGTYYVQLVESSTNPSLFRWTNYTITVTRNRSTPDDDGERLPGSGDSDDDDADDDGLSDDRERELGTDPRAADTDGDGLSDSREAVELGTDPTSEDTDDDGLTDECELRNDTDPTNPDADGDGTLDGREI